MVAKRSELAASHRGAYHMNLRGMSFALAGGALWGFSGTAVSYLFRESGIDPLWVMSVRMVLAGALFLLLALVRGDRRPFELMRDKSAVRDLVAFCGRGAIPQPVLLPHGHPGDEFRHRYRAAKPAAPAGVAVVACVIGRRAPKRREIAGMVLALAGTFLRTTGGDPSQMALPPAGLLFGLGAALGGAGLAVFPGRILAKYGVTAVNGWAMLMVGLVTAPFVPDWGQAPATLDGSCSMVFAALVVLEHGNRICSTCGACTRSAHSKLGHALHGGAHFRHGAERAVDQRRVLADRPSGLRAGSS